MALRAFIQRDGGVMPLIYRIPSELECAECLHTFEPELHPDMSVRVNVNNINHDQDYASLWIKCPKCGDMAHYDTEEIEVEYNDNYL